jgi:hypothetical protein
MNINCKVVINGMCFYTLHQYFNVFSFCVTVSVRFVSVANSVMEVGLCELQPHDLTQ